MWVLVAVFALFAWFMWGEFRRLREVMVRPCLRLMTREEDNGMTSLFLYNLGRGTAFNIRTEFSILEEPEGDEVIIVGQEAMQEYLHNRFGASSRAYPCEIMGAGFRVPFMTSGEPFQSFLAHTIVTFSYNDLEGNQHQDVFSLAGQPTV